MPHIALLGDSIFDNGAYVRPGPDVCAQVRQLLPTGWNVTLRAVDGATSVDVQGQLAGLPPDVTHLVLSVGGNDALMREDALQAEVASSAEALLLLEGVVSNFESSYRAAVAAALSCRRPLVLCTIYNGNFADAQYRKCVRMAIALYDDVIVRVALEHGLAVIDLRAVCSAADDYANDIEPSVLGGAKIAGVIVRAVGALAEVQAGAKLLGGA